VAGLGTSEAAADTRNQRVEAGTRILGGAADSRPQEAEEQRTASAIGMCTQAVLSGRNSKPLSITLIAGSGKRGINLPSGIVGHSTCHGKHGLAMGQISQEIVQRLAARG